MAGTIISTPAVGASDWSGWITQQGATDTGFMRLSLTNFAGTAASSVATGSVMECAGSIYTFSETAISLATGTASSSVAVYFTVIPSAGGTTCTVVMDSTVPTWVDAKQGFYASAASVTRVVGGAYIGTAATYYSKYLYTGENLVYCLQAGKTRPILKKTYELDEWNMDTIAQNDIAVDMLGPTIRNIKAIIRDDNNTNLYPLDYAPAASAVAGSYILYGTSYIVRLFRASGGEFDSGTFNATAGTVANRGYLYIEYEA